MRSGAWLVLLLLLAVHAADADTIVLKSGRRITAANVTVEGDRVYYETASGRSSVAKSEVDRIELGDSPAPSTSVPADLPLLMPRVALSEGYEEVARAAVHDGAVDGDYLAHLEDAARSGGAAAMNRLAVAYDSAALFQFQSGDVEQSLYLLRRGLEFAPENLSLLLNLSRLQLRRGEYSAALDSLERAERAAPNDPDTAVLLGFGYRSTNRLDRTVEEWKRALSLRPEPKLQNMLDRAQRDLQEELSYRAEESSHFAVRYSGSATAMFLPGEVLRTLESSFRDLQTELSFTPPESIAVILYTDQAFSDITQAPRWAGALNDGRIRVPIHGLTAVDDRLSRVLKHELTHSFIYQKTGGQCPTWLNEGVAQWMEGKRSEKFASGLAKAIEQFQSRAESAGQSLAPPAVLEGSWTGSSTEQAGALYSLSLAMVEYIVGTNGTGDIVRLLDAIAAGPSTEAALRTTLRMSYADLQRETARYLRRTYPQ
jgi:tetratricopeptide (TPR) repeat protein